MKKYSVVVPIYNDAYLAPALVSTLNNVMQAYLKKKSLDDCFELIFVNDGSKDDSISVLTKLANQYSFVKVVDFSRNFGQHIAIACGMREAVGEVVVRMNVDMQDHPSELPRFFDAMEAENLDLVVGQYELRESPFFNKLTAWIYYKSFHFLTGFSTPQNTSAMRCMSRRFVGAYNTLNEKSRFPQGLDQWLGFEQKLLPLKHFEREDGKSSYTFWSRLKLGLEGIIYFSDRPLTLIAIFGFFCSLAGFGMGLYTILVRLFGGDFLPGFASIFSIGLIALGLQLGGMGIVGLYVARTFKEVQNRPLYLIKSIYPVPTSFKKDQL